jgi:hypothetical protein
MRRSIALNLMLSLATCSSARQDHASISAATTRPSDDSAEARSHHSPDHPLRTVPILIGMPDKEMWEQMRRGEALLGGCVGIPGANTPQVCERCRWWKTDTMKYWQPLPEQFGEAKSK